MYALGLLQQWIHLCVSVVLFALFLWCFVNALRPSADAYAAAGKRTKVFWSALTGVAVLLGFLSLPHPLGIGGTSILISIVLLLIGSIITGLFLTDVRPALRRASDQSQPERG